jgi:hypothetical protein
VLPLKIPRTIALLKDCWQRAEEHVRSQVGTTFLEADEDFITILFCGKLRAEFDEKNQYRQFEHEFTADLAVAYPWSDLSWISDGLIAQVTHHPRHIEAATGGDFGFLVARPHVDARWGDPKITMHHQGLLVQAKRQRVNGKVGSLTRVQRAVLPSRLAYAAFLLYLREPPGEGLSPMIWMCPDGMEVHEVEADLASLNGVFAETIEDVRQIVRAAALPSGEIIEAMADGTRGTSDKDLIDHHISPDVTPAVTVEITWRDGTPPEPPRQHIVNRVYVHLRT